VPLLHFANFLNNVSPSQTSSRHRSFRRIAELHDAIRSAIPSFVELLKDVQWEARASAASALREFAGQREP
jgi:HEAT repeat protein